MIHCLLSLKFQGGGGRGVLKLLDVFLILVFNLETSKRKIINIRKFDVLNMCGNVWAAPVIDTQWCEFSLARIIVFFQKMYACVHINKSP